MERAIPTIVAAAVLTLFGCGSGEAGSPTPEACLGDADSYVSALASAPEGVLLDGSTPLGDCLPDEQEAGKLADVGQTIVAAAGELNRRARRRPLGESTVRLGYLVGVVKARAERTGGIHEDLARRLETAALAIPPGRVLPAGFQQRYEEGLAAGRESA